MLFLPGAGGNKSFWKPLSERLPHAGARRFFGWPGFCGVPRDAAVGGLADLARRVAEEMSEPVELFAQSMGGIIAVLAALERPGHVRHLVLSATSGGIDTGSLGAVDWRPEFRRNNPSVPRWFEEERWDLTSRLAELTCPVLLLWGDADPISPVAVGQRLQALLPNSALVVIPGGTHDLVAERVDEVAPHVARFLATCGS